MELDPSLLRESLRVLRVDKSRRRPPRVDAAHAEDRVALFNLICPVGTMVRYYPAWGLWDKATTHYVSDRACVSASGEPAVLLDGVSGRVSLWNCEPVVINAAEAA